MPSAVDRRTEWVKLSAPLDPELKLSVGSLIKSCRKLSNDARRAKADGIANAYRRVVTKLVAHRTEGRIAIPLSEWDALAERNGIHEAPDMWKAHLNAA